MTDDDGMAAFEQQRSRRKRTLAIVGLVMVLGLLGWKCAGQLGRFGIGGTGDKPLQRLELAITRDGRIEASGCSSDLEDCVARAKVRARNGTGDSRVGIRAYPGAPAGLVAEVRALIERYELTAID